MLGAREREGRGLEEPCAEEGAGLSVLGGTVGYWGGCDLRAHGAGRLGGRSSVSVQGHPHHYPTPGPWVIEPAPPRQFCSARRCTQTPQLHTKAAASVREK